MSTIRIRISYRIRVFYFSEFAVHMSRIRARVLVRIWKFVFKKSLMNEGFKKVDYFITVFSARTVIQYIYNTVVCTETTLMLNILVYMNSEHCIYCTCTEFISIQYIHT